ncbi:hypothetical protein [Streptomyces mutabilis]|uniref:hypothetical protein n=1 Tax=Streptomyces mutabilis TaxID=67332 RepID=UPI0012B6A069|nr:hypothetical protein [Streptomyces mutabilis]
MHLGRRDEQGDQNAQQNHGEAAAEIAERRLQRILVPGPPVVLVRVVLHLGRGAVGD